MNKNRSLLQPRPYTPGSTGLSHSLETQSFGPSHVGWPPPNRNHPASNGWSTLISFLDQDRELVIVFNGDVHERVKLILAHRLLIYKRYSG